MPMVPAKCTQCGGNLTVDSEKEAAICQYCGTPFIVEKAINNYNTTVINNFDNATVNIIAGDKDNFLKLAKDALTSKNYKEAYDYANKVLELETSNSDAWLTKMYAIEYLSAINNIREDEVLLCAKNALQHLKPEQKDEKTMEVYTYIIKRAEFLMQLALNKNNDAGEWNQLISIRKASNNNNYVAQFDNSGWYVSIARGAVKLKQFVPESAIRDNPEFQNIVYNMAKTFVLFCRDNARRLNLFEYEQGDERVAQYRELLREIKVGLKKDSQEISPSKIDGTTQYTWKDRLGFLNDNLFG